MLVPRIDRSMRVRVVIIGLITLLVVASSIFVAVRIFRAGFLEGAAETRFRQGYGGPRARVVLEQARKVAGNGVLVLGDSIVEMQVFSTLCGRPVLNGGISEIDVDRLAGRAGIIAEAARPSLVILAVGINDAYVGTRVPIAQWQARYRQLLGSLKGFHIIVVAVQPTEESKVLRRHHDPAYIAAQNEALRVLAAEVGARFVPPLASVAHLTIDGIHLNGAGDLKWRAAVEKACPN
jgi:lysophospholipase L1-like esterase